jgi:tetratricopeptide (TPR) repeat protein
LLAKGNEYFNNGSMDEANKYWESANKAFDDAIKIDPLNASYWNGKGSALLNMGGFEKQEEAAWAFDKAVQLDLQNARYWNHKGLALETVGGCDEAIEAHNKAIELDPDKALYTGTIKAVLSFCAADTMIRREVSRQSLSRGLVLEEMISLYGPEMGMGKLS